MKVTALITLLCFVIVKPDAGGEPGDVDLTFTPSPEGSEFPATLSAAVQPDGYMVIGGSFLTMGGAAHAYLSRISAFGTVDSSFSTYTDNVVQAVTLQDDSKLILAGQFATVNGAPGVSIVRLNPNGTVDSGFSASASDEVRTAIPLRDGKIIVAGFFPLLNGQPQRFLGRLNANGTLDTTFAPVLNARARTALIQPDGKIVVGGDFSTVNGIARNRIARLNADGSLDTQFNPNVTGSGVYCATLQPDASLIFAGAFTAVGGVARTNVARVTSGGVLDNSFNTGSNQTVRGLCLQTDGRVTFVGQFTQFGGQVKNRIARVLANGTLDTTFNASSDALVFGATQQADGKLVVMGQFSFFNSVPRSLLVRLENNPAVQSLTIPSPGRIQWLRSGSSPESSDVDFQLSTDGGTTWSDLGAATRISGGWERTGILLPANGQVRARARVYGAYGNSSRSILQSVASFTFPAQSVWRQQYFGTTANAGDAADNADPDKDGVTNLIEFAFGRHPLSAETTPLPEWQTAGGQQVLQFTLASGVSGITCRAEQSTTLQPGSWVELPNLASPPHYHFTAPASASRSFLRLQVTAP